MTGVYSGYQSVSKLIKELEWDTLSLRRTVNRLTNMYKILNKQIAIVIPPEVVKQFRSLKRSHKYSFIQIQTRVDSYKYSFFPRTTIDWNSLLESVVCQPSAVKFKDLSFDVSITCKIRFIYLFYLFISFFNDYYIIYIYYIIYLNF